jgi:WD40 repeat protein
MRRLALGFILAGPMLAQPAEMVTLATPAPASSFVLAKSGKVAAAVCEDQKLRVWALPQASIVRTIDLGGRNVYTVGLSADGAWIALADFGGSHTVWNMSTGATQMQLQLPSYPFALVFSPDGERLAVASAGEAVQVYEVASGKKLFDLQKAIGGSQNVAFSLDGQRIATADSDTVVRIYDGRNGELLARYTDFLLEPLTASFTADGKQLVTAGGDKVIAVLDASTSHVIRKSAKLTDPVAYLEVSPDGALTAAALMHADNLLMPAPLLISETRSGRRVLEWLPPSRVLGGGWTSDGHLLAATGAEQGVKLWRVH